MISKHFIWKDLALMPHEVVSLTSLAIGDSAQSVRQRGADCAENTGGVWEGHAANQVDAKAICLRVC